MEDIKALLLEATTYMQRSDPTFAARLEAAADGMGKPVAYEYWWPESKRIKRVAYPGGTPKDEVVVKRALYLAPPAEVLQHPDDAAVDRFALAMKAKLREKRAEGRGGWEDKTQCSEQTLSRLLHEHAAEGDPLDVANLAMMLHQRGEGITQPDAVPNRDAICQAVYKFFGEADNGDGTLAFDIYNSDDIDLLVDVILAAAPEVGE